MISIETRPSVHSKSENQAVVTNKNSK